MQISATVLLSCPWFKRYLPEKPYNSKLFISKCLQFQPTKRATTSSVRSSCLDSNLVSASVTLLRQLHNRDMFGASHRANWSQTEYRILELSESISWFGQVTPYRWKSMAFKQRFTNWMIVINIVEFWFVCCFDPPNRFSQDKMWVAICDAGNAKAAAKFQREQGLKIPTGRAWAPEKRERFGSTLPKCSPNCRCSND